MSRRARAIHQRQIKLRDTLWPGISSDQLWIRTERDGFATIPRTMPLITSIMDDMSTGKPLGATYIELWCRVFDEGFIILSKHQEMAFYAGFTGERAVRTWRERINRLAELGFIGVKSGPYGDQSYAIILNPYHVIQRHYDNKTERVRQDKYQALVARAIEIGATDFEDLEVEEASEALAEGGAKDTAA